MARHHKAPRIEGVLALLEGHDIAAVLLAAHLVAEGLDRIPARIEPHEGGPPKPVETEAQASIHAPAELTTFALIEQVTEVADADARVEIEVPSGA